MMEKDPHHWSRAWFKLGSNCDSVDNNICESFNKWIVQARYMPIITMLEAIQCKVMVRIQDMRTQLDKWAASVTICPNITKKLKKSINQSSYCHAIWNGNDSYEVKLREHRFTVKLEERTCTYRYWKLSGLPCSHAIACIYYHTNSLDDYIAKCYHVKEFRKTYEHCLQPVEGMSAWPISDRPRPVAPGHIAMPGRKKKSRTKEPDEKPGSSRVSKAGTTIRCGKCK
uniref:SWIM-type domain-containing protein n=1 Tax=Triticum urartu TaxID=4572 RepID=A0A8R7R5Z4_TRIUA